MKERILVLNGSFCEEPIIKKTKEMGYYVITTGNAPELQGHKFADEYIACDYSDKDAILNLVKDNHIDGIVSCANDFGSITASYVAEKMGWPGHDTYETSLIMHHKNRFKKFCEENQIPSPLSVTFTKKDEAMEYIKTCQYPVIVKANDLTGGKGILRADDIYSAQKAIENAFEKSRDKHILIEPYISGEQQTVVVFLANKKVISFCSNDCYSPINPYLIQAETFPAKNIDTIKQQMIDIAEFIAQKLQLQYIVSDGKPYIIETMRRCFGNQYLTLARKHTGFPWEEAYILASLGKECKHLQCNTEVMQYCGHHGIMVKKNGVIKNYTIEPEFAKHIFMKIEINGPGKEITDYMNQRIAYLYYQYSDGDEMRKAAERFNDMVHIEFEG